MNRFDTIFAFTQCKAAGGSHGVNSDGLRLYSYRTCIAEWVGGAQNKMLVINPTKYSNTTTRHMGILINILQEKGIQAFYLRGDAPVGIRSLSELFEKEKEQWY